MIDQPIVNLRTMDDLKKVMTVQRVITERAKHELVSVASDSQLLDDPTQMEQKTREFMAAERKILEKYAKNPTLTEFNMMPNLKGGTHFGATFGVTVLVGELILEQVKVMQDKFKNVLRGMFLILLMELDRPRHRYLIEPLEKAMKFHISKPNGDPVPLEEQAIAKKKMCASLAESFLVVSKEYGLVDVGAHGAGWSLTPIGKRVLLHLLDAEKFVTLLTEAHTRLNRRPVRPN